MLGVQNSVSVANPIKFGRNQHQDYSRFVDYDNDCFDASAYEAERDEKMSEIQGAQNSLDEMASALEKNNDKVSKKASKVVRVGSAILGLVGTFVMAKYGSKVMVNSFRNLANSKGAQKALTSFKNFAGPKWSAISKAAGNIASKCKNSSAVQSLKQTSVAKKFVSCLEKPMVKEGIQKLGEYKSAFGTFLKSINADKIQKVVENTLAGSATASVLIDDLAGRNDDKSNLDVALGVSGGQE